MQYFINGIFKLLASNLNAKLPGGFNEPRGLFFVRKFRLRASFRLCLCGFCHTVSQSQAVR